MSFDDETRPLRTHRYGEPGAPGGAEAGDAEPGPYGAPTPYGTAWGADPAGPEHLGAEAPPKARLGSGLVAGLLTAALVVGGLAGVLGAAGFGLVGGSDGSPGALPTTQGTTSEVVDRPDTPAADGSVQQVAASVLPSVVKINVRGNQGQGSGSGVVISSDGEILTNDHVVEVAGQGGTVTVSFNDGSTTRATVVGTDPLTDLAVIKAEGVSGLTPATLGSSDNLDVGEEVVAIGSPFGLEATVTSGIVSALDRPVSVSGASSAIDTTYPAIQTDAAINPGNSGGPLVNMQGEVVGINSSIRSGSSAGAGGSIGLGFSIPLDKVQPIVEQLRAGETATHARLGVTVSDATSRDGLVTGAGVQEVTSGSAADEAGMQSGDIVTRVDDQPITDASSLVATVRGYRPDDAVTLTVVRDGEEQTLEATLDSDEGQSTS